MIVSELEKNGIKGIVPSHGDILVFLYQKNRFSVKELSEKIHRTQPTVTVLVNKLEKLGYVEKIKDKEDNRITWIKLADKGIQLQPVFQSISEKLNDAIYGGLTDTQKEQLELMLENVYRRF
ncbi:MarR family winged helix-turn-helix transcriptional regulator [Cohnella suwonensis]|uniref:MarR family winged helix-turn-helix transcriptional regulator n=1 Tax=Cohnella suwonensis TaxID=696072 RepID=A0ABW0LT58_9BACL